MARHVEEIIIALLINSNVPQDNVLEPILCISTSAHTVIKQESENCYNANKSQAIVHSICDMKHISLNNLELLQSEDANYLGIHLDRRFTKRIHIFAKSLQRKTKKNVLAHRIFLNDVTHWHIFFGEMKKKYLLTRLIFNSKLENINILFKPTRRSVLFSPLNTIKIKN